MHYYSPGVLYILLLVQKPFDTPLGSQDKPCEGGRAQMRSSPFVKTFAGPIPALLHQEIIYGTLSVYGLPLNQPMLSGIFSFLMADGAIKEGLCW